MIVALFICMLGFQTVPVDQVVDDKLPSATRVMLKGKFPGWKFAEVNQEVQQYFQTQLKGQSPHLISGDFDGNKQRDYATLIWHGSERNAEGKVIGPRSFLVVFLRQGRGFRMYVIDPDGEYLGLAKKGTKDYNYNEQKEITYANVAITTNHFEKGGTSYVFERGRFRCFVSSD
jgi:hypothetical protein